MSNIPGYTPGTLDVPGSGPKLSKKAKQRLNRQKKKQEEENAKILAEAKEVENKAKEEKNKESVHTQPSSKSENKNNDLPVPTPTAAQNLISGQKPNEFVKNPTLSANASEFRPPTSNNHLEPEKKQHFEVKPPLQQPQQQKQEIDQHVQRASFGNTQQQQQQQHQQNVNPPWSPSQQPLNQQQDATQHLSPQQQSPNQQQQVQKQQQKVTQQWSPQHQSPNQQQQQRQVSRVQGGSIGSNNNRRSFDIKQNQQGHWNKNRDQQAEKRNSDCYENYRTYDYNGDYFDVSKELARILRHGKYKWINMDNNGFCYVDDITHCKRFLEQFGKIEFSIIKQIVDSNDKKRFVLKQENDGKWKISAAQGHSIQVKELDLKPITDPTKYPEVVHGTYFESWEHIKKTGLNRMTRTHIHFAMGMPGDKEVISGMRKSCELIIKLDLDKAMKDGLKFFVSSNNVILCAGDNKGRIHPKYFAMVIQLYPYQKLYYDVPPDFVTESKPKNLKANKPAQTGSKSPDPKFKNGNSNTTPKMQNNPQENQNKKRSGPIGTKKN